MALHIVLVEPEIPPNTGNISRTCAATGTVLHLVQPLGFSLDDKQLKRAGLDYWPHLSLQVHPDLEDCLQTLAHHRLWLATTKGKRCYADVAYRDEDVLFFGRETRGLPADFIRDHQEQTLRIPMSQSTHQRSINLSNAAAVVLYEALRQLDFPHMD